jgi:hypothetical protein
MMTKKPLSRLEGMQDWFKNEAEKDRKDLEISKLKFLAEIKQYRKEDIIPKGIEVQKLTLWMKIKKVLMG